MAKKITGYVKLQVPAGAANPSPPIGPALGQRGVNIMEFCKAFNAATQELEKGAPIPTVITVFADRSFAFATKTPPASFLLKKAAKIKSGSAETGKVSAGTIRRSQLREIAEVKMTELKANATATCDGRVGAALDLGVDPRHAGQMVRGVVNLPKGTGKSVRVAVFAKGAKADEATAAGADVVGAEELMETIQCGTSDFDR